jgi:hypothetical protein
VQQKATKKKYHASAKATKKDVPCECERRLSHRDRNQSNEKAATSMQQKATRMNENE